MSGDRRRLLVAKGEEMRKLFLGIVAIAAVAASIPASASAAEYETFVGCDYLAANPAPATACAFDDIPGAFFEADEDTTYDVCIEAPNGDVFCLKEERDAKAGVRDVVALPAEEPGAYFVVWFVGVEQVGSWELILNPPPPLPVRTPLPAPPPAVAPVVTGPSQRCLKARKRVTQLKNRLQNAHGRKQKAKVRGKLKGAKTRARKAC